MKSVLLAVAIIINNTSPVGPPNCVRLFKWINYFHGTNMLTMLKIFAI